MVFDALNVTSPDEVVLRTGVMSLYAPPFSIRNLRLVPTPIKFCPDKVIQLCNDRAIPSKVEEFIRVHPPIFSGVPCLNRTLLHSNQPPSLV